MPDRHAPPDLETNRINFSWLLRLRTGEIVGQLVIVLVAVVRGFELPLAPILTIIGVEIASNLAAARWLRRVASVTSAALAVVLALDVLFFTALLALTGGPYNPFSFLYLIQIALGAVILSPAASYGLAVLCFSAFAALFNWHIWLPLQGQELGPHELHHLQAHVRGMWIGLAVAAGFIVTFVQRVRRALAVREQELFRASDLARRNERLASLATLSAGAAHELSTPLSTIAVVARELERRMESAEGKPELLDDVRLVRAQVDRCRGILTRMAASAGESAGEAPERVDVAAVISAALSNLDKEPAVVTDVQDLDGRQLRVPPVALAQALQGIVRNAQQASPPDAPVQVRGKPRDGVWVFEVEDRGPGMDAATLARAGEPFFTTKMAGEGMGLGLFLARTTVEQLGGSLEIDSQMGCGTVVRLIVPCDDLPH